MADTSNWRDRLRHATEVAPASTCLPNSPKSPELPSEGASAGGSGKNGNFGNPSEDSEWTSADWCAWFDERAAVFEHDGGMSRDNAEAAAGEDCVTEWLRQHPLPSSSPAACAWCGRTETSGSSIVPFGVREAGYAWLHHECWQPWQDSRRVAARRALTRLELPLGR